jgi:hypothetical protein
VHGILLYYPYLRGAESRPNPESRNSQERAYRTAAANHRALTGTGTGTDTAGAGTGTGSNVTAATNVRSSNSGAVYAAGADATDASGSPRYGGSILDNGEVSEVDGDPDQDYSLAIDDFAAAADDSESSRTVTINVFWVNRLVPISIVQRLPFFPDAVTKGQCDKLQLPEKWRGRLKGYIFFGNTFSCISNNKLRIQVDPSLDDWLNDRNRQKQIMFTPAAVKPQFLK